MRPDVTILTGCQHREWNAIKVGISALLLKIQSHISFDVLVNDVYTVADLYSTHMGGFRTSS